MTTSPRVEQHSLCGPVSVTPEYEGTPIVDGDGGPVTYDEDTNVFTVDEDDPTFEETVKEYGLLACFVNYPCGDGQPGVISQNPTENINFGNPCLDPFDF